MENLYSLPKILRYELINSVYKWTNWEDKSLFNLLQGMPKEFLEKYMVSGEMFRGINQDINYIKNMSLASWSYDVNVAFYVGYRYTPNNFPTHIFKREGDAFSLLKVINDIAKYLKEGGNYTELKELYNVNEDLVDFLKCLRFEEEELIASFDLCECELIKTIEGFPDYIKDLEIAGYFEPFEF